MRMLFFLVLVGMIASCGKKHTVHIKAVNPVTGQVYVGLKYRISQEKTTLWDEKTKIIASGELNENGEANATFRRGNNPIRVQVEWPSNCCYSKNDVYYIKGDGPNHEVLVEFAECAYLKLNIINVNCQGGGDIMKFRSKYPYTEWQNWSGDRTGCYAYTSPYPFEVPAGWRVYEWRVNRNGVITNYIDSIYLISGADNGTFDMEY